MLLGPPGAGKGTLGHLLKETYGLIHISTGDILREEMKENTKFGGEIKKIIETGGLVPDEVVTKIIENKLTADAALEKGYLLDGFPRTTTQAKDLDKILARIKKPINYAIYFEVSLPVIIQRLTGRRVCQNCGALYHMTNKPPKKRDVCDVCGGPLYQRADDNEATIQTRIEVYTKNTAPIVDYYQRQGKLKRVNADRDAAAMKNDLINIFNENRKINNAEIGK